MSVATERASREGTANKMRRTVAVAVMVASSRPWPAPVASAGARLLAIAIAIAIADRAGPTALAVYKPEGK